MKFSFQIKIKFHLFSSSTTEWQLIPSSLPSGPNISFVVAERPKIMPHVSLMKKNISEILNIDENLIGIKATTNEKLGPEGREEGISCHSVVLIEKK